MQDALSLIVRATITYAYLLTVVRLAGKRTIGEGTPLDFIVALIIGDTPDDIIWGEVPLAQGLVAIGSVVCLHLFVAYVAHRSIRLDRAISSAAALVITNGRFAVTAQSRERLSDEDLKALVRLQAIQDPGEIRAGRIEPSGHLSALRTDEAKTVQRKDIAEVRRLLE